MMGAGFTWMAWKLAISRVYPELQPCAENFSPERMTERCTGAAEMCEHCEYYNMLDLVEDARKCHELCGSPTLLHL